MKSMHIDLTEIKTKVYDTYGWTISEFSIEPESATYEACRYKLNGFNIISRKAKITPKKSGQFVTFWKRNGNGTIEPFYERDSNDFYTVIVRTEGQLGQFVFPKSVLIEKGIISTHKKEGKRAFRVYPPWDIVKNKQAENTQTWQLKYFYEINVATDLNKAKKLYTNNP